MQKHELGSFGSTTSLWASKTGCGVWLQDSTSTALATEPALLQTSFTENTTRICIFWCWFNYFFHFLNLHRLIFTLVCLEHSLKMSHPVTLSKTPKRNQEWFWKRAKDHGCNATQKRSPSTSPCQSWGCVMPDKEHGQALHTGHSNVRAKDQLNTCLAPVCKATAPTKMGERHGMCKKWEII